MLSRSKLRFIFIREKLERTLAPLSRSKLQTLVAIGILLISMVYYVKATTTITDMGVTASSINAVTVTANNVSSSTINASSYYLSNETLGFVEPTAFIVDVLGSNCRMWYGANNTLAYSSTDAIQVINYAIGNSSVGPVTLCDGTYLLSDTIVPKNYVRLLGQSREGTILKGSGNLTGNIIGYSGSSDLVGFSVENLMIRDSPASGIYLQHCSWLTLRNLNITNCTASGIHLRYDSASMNHPGEISSCRIDYCNYGVYLQDDANDMKLWGNDVAHCNIHGLYVNASGGEIATDNHLWYNGEGLTGLGSNVYLFGADNNIIEANHIDSSFYDGVWVRGMYNRVIGNSLFNNGQHANQTYVGIMLDSFSNNIVADNMFWVVTNGNWHYFGIAEQLTADYNTIANNDVTNTVAGISRLGVHTKLSENMGFVTENTILNVANTTATTFVFNHECASTVNSVQCSFDLTVQYTWMWTSTTTQVTVTVTPASGVTLPATMHILSADVKYIP